MTDLTPYDKLVLSARQDEDKLSDFKKKFYTDNRKPQFISFSERLSVFQSDFKPKNYQLETVFVGKHPGISRSKFKGWRNSLINRGEIVSFLNIDLEIIDIIYEKSGADRVVIDRGLIQSLNSTAIVNLSFNACKSRKGNIDLKPWVLFHNEYHKHYIGRLITILNS